MARKNKKKNMNGFIFPAPFAGVVVLISTVALSYVWLGCRCESLGRELKALELEKTALNKKYLNEEYKWTRMKSPRNIERVLTNYNIVMTWPRRDQVVRLVETRLPSSRPVAADSGLRRTQAANTPTYAMLERVVMND